MFSEEFLAKIAEAQKDLEEQIEIIEKINGDFPLFKEDLGEEVGEELKREIERIEGQNRRYLEKLKNRRFEIAVVGLEKAGKSTFINALIGNNILPSAPERCTFTSTKLTYGGDEAIVEFYSRSEFNKIFQSMLADLNYPDFEKANFETMGLSQFVNFFNSLEKTNPILYKEHQGKTDEEIKDILKHKSEIGKYLGSPARKFSGEELIKESFQSFIRGENRGKNTSKPRSVKNVEIRSSKLSKIQYGIIFDVPGFDSPTRIHERQTLERLKSADAIVLITNAGRNPSIRGTELNILRKEADQDGIKLIDKLFVFGNQIDLAENPKHNETILREDLTKKYKLTTEDKVFVGSAKLHLEKIKGKTIRKIETGIDKFYNRLVDYYQNERFEIVNRRVKENRSILIDFVRKIDTNLKIKDISSEINRRRTILIRKKIREIEEEVVKELKRLKKEIKKEIQDEKYFSSKFQEKVKEEEIFKKIDEEWLEDAHIEVNQSITLEKPVENINIEARRRLHRQFLNQFVDIIREITDKKGEEYEKRIGEIFYKALNIKSDKLQRELEAFLNDLLKDKRHNFNRFEYLIDRFARNIFDALILYHRGSIDRLGKFKSSKLDFEFLDHHFNKRGKLISMILNGSPKDDIAFYISDFIRRNRNLNLQQALGLNLVELVISEVQNKLTFRKSETETAVLEEINGDIDNLKETLVNAVMPAVHLELAFCVNLDKEINEVINSFKSSSPNSDKMDHFLSHILIHYCSDIFAHEEELLEINRRKEELKKFFKKVLKESI